jgi:uncharacterized protein (TIGR02186 family)
VRRVALLLLAIVAATGAARAEKLTVAVSTPEVRISSNFAGTPVTVFGVIEDGTPVIGAVGAYKVAILVLGPTESVVARRKDRVLGVWANRAARTIGGAPSFYSLTTSEDLDTLASPAVLQRLQIGFDNIVFAFDGLTLAKDPETQEFRDAFIRLKTQAGLYEQNADVGFVGNLIFRSSAFLPANIPVGRYTVLAYLFSGGELIAHAQDRIEVSKTGFEGTMAAFARNQSLVYGVLCAALALFVGWLGGVIFRRD